MNVDRWLWLGLLMLSACQIRRRTADPQAFLRQDRIAASQGVASPLVFTAPKGLSLHLSDFQDPRELSRRGGLPNFFAKLKTGKVITVAFIGGSVTQLEYMYRNQTAAWLEKLYPKTRFRFINAGVSGSGTELAACRVQEQVLRFQPDLVFIDFAVNGSYLPGLEGVLRQVIRHDPSTDICLLYATMTGQPETYQARKIPENIAGMEKLAAYYQLPGIQLGIEVAARIAGGKLAFTTADRRSPDMPVFADGVHPTIYGGDLYAGVIARCLLQLQENTKPRPHELPAPLQADNWEDGTMVSPDLTGSSGNWATFKPADTPRLAAFAPWFPLVKTGGPGSNLHFSFRGTAVGLFDIGGPEAGQVSIRIDGGAARLLNRFNRWCNNRYRGQYDFVYMPAGQHRVEISVSADRADKSAILGGDQLADITANPQKYDRQVLYLGKILLKGQLLTDEKP